MTRGELVEKTVSEPGLSSYGTLVGAIIACSVVFGFHAFFAVDTTLRLRLNSQGNKVKQYNNFLGLVLPMLNVVIRFVDGGGGEAVNSLAIGTRLSAGFLAFVTNCEEGEEIQELGFNAGERDIDCVR